MFKWFVSFILFSDPVYPGVESDCVGGCSNQAGKNPVQTEIYNNTKQHVNNDELA